MAINKDVMGITMQINEEFINNLAKQMVSESIMATIDGGKSYKAKASTFRFNNSGVRVYCERNFMGRIGFEGIFGKTVFLTREEAEAAMDGGQENE